jgi:hypothetical protein
MGLPITAIATARTIGRSAMCPIFRCDRIAQQQRFADVQHVDLAMSPGGLGDATRRWRLPECSKRANDADRPLAPDEAS